MYKYKNIINKDFLSFEFYRLVELFIPDELGFLPDISFSVLDSHPKNFAAKCCLETNKIEFYLNYHVAYPEDYKTTLLHEAGHFIYGLGHQGFEDYYSYLKVRQRGIPELVVPRSYCEFRYCHPINSKTYKFKCSGCLKSLEEISFDRAYCFGCDKQMLLVSGL
jgi:hypothetical protein